MRRELLIAAGPGEWRAAWLEDGAAVELHVERGDIRPAGSIHLGRIVRRTPGLAAVLVDIGDERPGFLPLQRGSGDDHRLDEGGRVVVQVRREARRDKGALLATRIEAADGETEAAGLSAATAGVDPPAQLAPAPGFAAALKQRLPGEPDRVVVDDAATLAELRRLFAGAEIASQHVETWPFDLDAAFADALSPTVALSDHARIHIEETATAVLIDVDTGTPAGGPAGGGASAANIAAAAAIARQLRLRQIVGGIVVDFAALEGHRRRERVRRAMAAGLTGDPARPEVLGWTRLGHLEIVRPRRGRSLAAAMLEPAGQRKTAATLGFEALRTVWRESRARPSGSWRIDAAPAVEAALRGPAAAALRALETRLGRPVAVTIIAGGAAPPFDIAML